MRLPNNKTTCLKTLHVAESNRYAARTAELSRNLREFSQPRGSFGPAIARRTMIVANIDPACICVRSRVYESRATMYGREGMAKERIARESLAQFEALQRGDNSLLSGTSARANVRMRDEQV